MHSELSEFELIQRFFKTGSEAMLASNNPSIPLGIGDDCALLALNPEEVLAITSDMLVEDRHFFANANPEWLGHKALAVNLSDLAAMGAKPLGFTLAIALPQTDLVWLEAFSKGLFTLAQGYSCPLIGGDTTAGPLNICITAFGSIPQGKAIKRSGALPGNDVWVSGTVGDARLVLAALRHELRLLPKDLQAIGARMHQPTPRIQLGMELRDIATSAIDISDGLLGDLKHILLQSKVDAEIFLESLPKSVTLQDQTEVIQHQFAACGGDDYEICFTALPDQRGMIGDISKKLNLPITQIGSIKTMQSFEPKIELLDRHGKTLSESKVALLSKSFDHFA
jgi:thiamine-monophosphate kinase